MLKDLAGVVDESDSWFISGTIGSYGLMHNVLVIVADIIIVFCLVTKLVIYESHLPSDRATSLEGLLVHIYVVHYLPF